MPNLRDIKRRITSVEKTQQITSAMRMVAAAKLRRAQESIEAARPYADRMRSTLGEVAASQTEAAHPLLKKRDEVRTVEFVVVTSDRGLAGAFNANVLKKAAALIAEREKSGVQIEVTTVGRKATEYFRRHRASQLVETEGLDGWVSYDDAARIGRRIIHRFNAEEVDEVLEVFRVGAVRGDAEPGVAADQYPNSDLAKSLYGADRLVDLPLVPALLHRLA